MPGRVPRHPRPGAIAAAQAADDSWPADYVSIGDSAGSVAFRAVLGSAAGRAGPRFADVAVSRRRGQDPAERVLAGLAAVPPGVCLSECADGLPGAAPGRSGWWWGMAASAGSRWCTGRGGTRRWCPEGREWRDRNSRPRRAVTRLVCCCGEVPCR
jgi:hypothetical protein